MLAIALLIEYIGLSVQLITKTYVTALDNNLARQLLTRSRTVVQFAGPSAPDADQSKRLSTGVTDDHQTTGVVTSNVGARRRRQLAASDY